MLNETWRDQYNRMIRSRDRLLNAALPTWQQGSAEARDTLYHFFQDAYHLKDWLIADLRPAFNKSEVERLFDHRVAASPIEMRICADLCNRTKHFILDYPPRTGDKTTAFICQSVNWHSGLGVAHCWTIVSNSQTYDAVVVAQEVVANWDTWLNKHGLVPHR